MDDVSQYPFLVGALLPLAISLLKQASWSTQQKRVAAAVVSVVAAVVTYFIEQGGWVGWGELVASAGVIYALAQVTYMGFWEGTDIEQKAAAVGS